MEDVLKVFLLAGWLLIVNAVSQEKAPATCPASLPDQSVLRVYNGVCYEFVNLERYWNVAQDDCSSKGGNLIMIGDQATQAFVMAALKDMDWDRNGVWIGAHDKTTEGTWQWVTGKAVTWSNWDAHQPSCYLPKLRVFCAEDCAILRLTAAGKWHDKRCNTPGFSYTYICEYRLLPTSESTTTGLNTTEVDNITESTSAVTATTNLTSSPDDKDSVTLPTGNQTQWGENVTSADSTVTEDTTYSLTHGDEIIVPTKPDCSDTTKATCAYATPDDQSIVHAGRTADTTEENTTEPPDYVEVETKLPVLETTHIIIGKYGDEDSRDDYEYEYHALPEATAAQTKVAGHVGTKKSVTGPVVGTLVGLCLLAAVMVSAYFLHRRRRKNQTAEWTVGFDNPNYGSQDAPSFAVVRGEGESAQDDIQRVNVFPPEESDPLSMPGACAAPEACCSSASNHSTKGNEYVFHDFSDRKM